jgi:hypothetical protein
MQNDKEFGLVNINPTLDRLYFFLLLLKKEHTEVDVDRSPLAGSGI